MSLSRKELLDEMGISPQWVLRDRPAVARPSEAPIVRAESPVSRVESPAVAVEPVRQAQGRENVEMSVDEVSTLDWPSLRRKIQDCQACGLCAARKQAVPGVGDENASWLFIGEGPGAEEDARGEPFVGQAGKLLDAMLKAIDLERGQDVYIANAVKCRPPGNRTPEASEMAACWPYLKRQIELLSPKIIVLLGKAAVFAVLGEEGTLSGLRGKRLSYRDGDMEIPVVVTYHPAYLLRNLPDKAKAWEDLCRARRLLRELEGAAPA